MCFDVIVKWAHLFKPLTFSLLSQTYYVLLHYICMIDLTSVVESLFY